MTQLKTIILTATYRIVTPMFCSGADQSAAELRLPSFKGALRFWWRAIEWGRFYQSAAGDVTAATSNLRAEEASLFGSSDVGQSRISLSCKWNTAAPDDSELVRDWPPNKPPTGSAYLGFGITESGRRDRNDLKPHRVGLPSEREFQVRCRLRHGVSSVDVESLRRALQILGFVGGLGSRSRRGFGSMAITDLDGRSMSFTAVNDYQEAISEIVKPTISATEFPPYTAFSRNVRIAFLPLGSDAFKVHHDLGERYREFRGQPGPHRGRTKTPLGLPLKDVDDVRRRSSPLLLHVHPIGGQFVATVLFMPSDFHPDIPQGRALGFYEIVNTWMNELKGVAL